MVKFSLPSWYTTPMTQIILVGFTCFCTPGMYSALNNLGAGGIQDVALSDTANGVLYGCFALGGLVAGGICNLLGPPFTLFLGTLGYALYVGALWCHQTQGTRWFLIFAGAILGLSASLLWAAQGEIMMSYPLEKDKGKSFSIFWAIFQLGTFIGSVISLAINIRSGQLTAVATGTYAFIIIILIGVASSFLVLGPNHIIRPDGTLVKLSTKTSTTQEVKGMIALFKNWKMLALLPMFFASNYFYSYQGAINANIFDGPTRALNATLSGAGAIIGALLIGFIVLDDSKLWKLKRRTRGYLGFAIVTGMTIIVWGVGLSWQVTFNRADFTDANRISYHQANYKGKGALFFFYYFGDACYQALAYWIMSALTNEPFTLARYAGFYKAIQSAGGAVSFGMDAISTPFLTEHLVSWILMLTSFPLAFLVLRTVKETNYEDEQMIYVSDLPNLEKEAMSEGKDSKSGETEEERAEV
ncbi:hypothetical protein M422DRAFT_226229 [Sphaerobolus stellatus SS14]|uniref:Autophagy-related protein n=1 Tax=Sphaerobolus stellatus (strain SS14) TaxID=990650 RepID=A0A0C9UW66_SPHS4|nr:hypothetical protein M422DRAFT_226229 [Sphaerobolus stellatus SS14]